MGGGKGGSQETKVKVPGFIKSPSQTASSAAIEQFGQGPFQFFPGQTFAGFDPLQTQAQQQQLALAPSAQQQAQQAQQALLSSLSLGGAGADPFLQQQLASFDPSTFNVLEQEPLQAQLGAIESRATRNLLENILPNVRRQATGAGQTFGSTRSDIAQAQAIGDVSQRIAEAQAGLIGQAQATGLGAGLQARGQGLQAGLGARGQDIEALGRSLALFPQIQQAGLFPSQLVGDVGAQRQGLEQQAINEAIQRFQFEQAAPQQSLNALINQISALSPVGAGGSVTQTQANANPLLGALGGGILGSQLGAAVPGFGAGAAGATGLAALGPAGIGLGIGGALLGGLFG